jgi:hypothetical protein
VRGDANSGMADAGCGAEQDHALLLVATAAENRLSINAIRYAVY